MIDNAVAILFLAWYIFTGYLFAELMRMSAKQHGGSIWSISYAVIVFGWIAMIPPTIFANVANEARRKK